MKNKKAQKEKRTQESARVEEFRTLPPGLHKGHTGRPEGAIQRTTVQGPKKKVNRRTTRRGDAQARKPGKMLDPTMENAGRNEGKSSSVQKRGEAA